MKKFLSILLSFVMLLTLTMPAMAAEDTGNSKDVTANYDPIYTITIQESEHGTVSANLSEATAGTEVTLTIEPEARYVLSALSVKDDAGNAITVADGKTFSMPESNVTISATFSDAPSYDVNISTDIVNGSVVSTLEKAIEGDSVTLTVTPNVGYELESLVVANVDVTSEVTEGSYTFVMGNQAVTVSATFKAISYSVTIIESSNGVISSDKQTATVGETVTLTVEPNAKYELHKITVTDADGNTVDVTDKSFIMPASDVKVEAIFWALPVISADISWGSMSFTYTEENGWQNDGSDRAGTVSVTNAGDTAFSASVKYTPADDYTEIEGTIDTAALNLGVGESQTFKLTLSGKPNKALKNATIGTVTVVIDEVIAVEVSDLDALKNAVANGAYIKLMSDVDLYADGTLYEIVGISPLTIDLNGFEVNSTHANAALCLKTGSRVYVSNGTLSAKCFPAWTFSSSSLYLKNCVIYHTRLDLSGTNVGVRAGNGSNIVLDSCTVETDCILAENSGSTVTLKNVSGDFSIYCSDEGVVYCDFDPTGRVIKGTITDNGDGTWTVS